MILTVALAVAGVVICGLIFYTIYRRQNPKADKAQGRGAHKQAAVNALRRFARDNDFEFAAPARVLAGGKTAALDAVAAGQFGAVGLIALGYNGEVYGSATDDEWLQVGSDGTRTPFPNPAKEASAAVRVLRQVLIAGGQRRAQVEVAYVFTGQNVQLALPRSLAPMNVKAFKTWLSKERFLEDKGLDPKKLMESLKQAMDSE